MIINQLFKRAHINILQTEQEIINQEKIEIQLLKTEKKLGLRSQAQAASATAVNLNFSPSSSGCYNNKIKHN